jgi:hypothetical protein
LTKWKTVRTGRHHRLLDDVSGCAATGRAAPRDGGRGDTRRGLMRSITFVVPDPPPNREHPRAASWPG